jgi:hypothetical protein
MKSSATSTTNVSTRPSREVVVEALDWETVGKSSSQRLSFRFEPYGIKAYPVPSRHIYGTALSTVDSRPSKMTNPDLRKFQHTADAGTRPVTLRVSTRRGSSTTGISNAKAQLDQLTVKALVKALATHPLRKKRANGRR